MMRFRIVALAIGLCSLIGPFASGQARISGGTSGMKVELSARDVYGKANYKVYYKLNYVSDKSIPEVTKTATCILLVGEKSVLFEDYVKYRQDSILFVASQDENADFQKTVNACLAVGKDNLRYSTVLLPPKKKYVYQTSEVAFAKYRYEDKLPNIDWHITTEKKSISGYVCHKATTTFSGRTYEAWYAPEIPLSFGPYIMYGLPGLILEMKDTAREYVFTFAGMEKAKKDDTVFLDRSKRLEQKSRTEVRQIIRNFMADSEKAFGGRVVSVDGQAPSNTRISMPYNPIELE